MLISSIKKNEPIKKNYVANTNRPKVIFLKKGFFYPSFFSKIVGIVFTPHKSIIKSWHYNNELSNWAFNKILSFTLFSYDFFLNKNLLFFANIFQKKKNIFLNKKDIVLFGAWPHIYYHKLIDFILRINFLKIKKYNKIYLPIFLKKILRSYPYSEVFSKINFYYYKYDCKIIFHNLTYVSSLNYYRDNIILRNCILDLKNSIKKKINLKSNKYRYSLISRKNVTRGLENEDELFLMLKKYKFKRFFFENLSFLEQIKICYNSEIIVGVQGSGLANLIFMKKNSNLVHLSNIYINNPQVKELAISAGVNFYDINFSVNRKSSFGGKINVDYVEKKINSIIESK
jgi:hypothetical protein